MDYPSELQRKMDCDAWNRQSGWTRLAEILDMAPKLPEPANTKWATLPTMEQLLGAVTHKTEDGTQYGTYHGVAFKLAPT